MKLHVLGSSSKGNSYVLQSSKQEYLVIDAGVRFDEVKKSTDYNVSDISGVLVSHSHGDHIKYLSGYMQYGVVAYLSEATAKAYGEHRNMRYVQARKKYRVGSYSVMPFELEHDVPCFGFIISHEEMGILVYLTDTMYSKVMFATPVNHWLIEANYDAEILDEVGAGFLRNRVMHSHMSIDTTLGILNENQLAETRNIILCHLSDRNSNAKDFLQRTVAATGKQVFIAEPGLEVNLDLKPF